MRRLDCQSEMCRWLWRDQDDPVNIKAKPDLCQCFLLAWSLLAIGRLTVLESDDMWQYREKGFNPMLPEIVGTLR